MIPARSSAAVLPEIGHLLRFIGQSGCVFIRNGKEHSSIEAREHIQKKYDYVEDRVRTAEDFIAHTGTKSSVTGKAYQVRCGGQVLPAAEWLRAELESFRLGGEKTPSRAERSSP